MTAEQKLREALENSGVQWATGNPHIAVMYEAVGRLLEPPRYDSDDYTICCGFHRDHGGHRDNCPTGKYQAWLIGGDE